MLVVAASCSSAQGITQEQCLEVRELVVEAAGFILEVPDATSLVSQSVRLEEIAIELSEMSKTLGKTERDKVDSIGRNVYSMSVKFGTGYVEYLEVDADRISEIGQELSQVCEWPEE